MIGCESVVAEAHRYGKPNIDLVDQVVKVTQVQARADSHHLADLVKSGVSNSCKQGPLIVFELLLWINLNIHQVSVSE